MLGWQKCVNRRNFLLASVIAARSAAARAVITVISVSAEFVCGKWPMKVSFPA